MAQPRIRSVGSLPLPEPLEAMIVMSDVSLRVKSPVQFVGVGKTSPEGGSEGIPDGGADRGGFVTGGSEVGLCNGGAVPGTPGHALISQMAALQPHRELLARRQKPLVGPDTQPVSLLSLILSAEKRPRNPSGTGPVR